MTDVLAARREARQELWIKTTADALDLVTEFWPKPEHGGAVYLTADQWKRLRQVLISLPDLGD